MRTLRFMRPSRGGHRHSTSEYVRKPVPRLAVAAGVIAAVLAVSAPGYTQGMPNGSTVQQPQTGATTQRVQTNAVQPPKTAPVQHSRASAAARRAQTGATVQAARPKATVQHAQIKPTPPRTVGAHTVAKETKPAIPIKAAMPRPDPELLAPASEPNCAFDSTRTDVDDRQKLDYERQCYRHAEMIIRARLQRLQGDVDQMIKAVKRESVSDSR